MTIFVALKSTMRISVNGRRLCRAGDGNCSARALELNHGKLALTVEHGKIVMLEWQEQQTPA